MPFDGGQKPKPATNGERMPPGDAELRDLGRRLAEVVHDLRNPLASILALSDVLCEAEDGETSEVAKRIHHNARICRELVDDVLHFATERRPAREPLDLAELVQTTLDARPPRRPGIRIRAAVREPLPPVAARAADLRRVLLNLLRNAEDAMHGAGVTGEIVVGVGSAACDGERCAELTVSDEGPGFPAALLVDDPGRSGPGLGLAICTRILEEHGGALRIENGRTGALVRCRLPLRRPGAEKIATAAGPGEDATPDLRVRAPLDILVIDDSESTLETYRRVLELDGHRVTLENRGASGFERLVAGRFDVVLVDVRLPDLPGPVFYERVGKRRPEMLENLVFATGDASNENTRDFLNATGNPYLVKPFVIDELRAALALAVRDTRPEKNA